MTWVRTTPSVEGGEEATEAQLHGTIRALVMRASRIESHQSEAFVAIAEPLLQNLSITPSQCCEWLSVVIPGNTRTGKGQQKRARNCKPDHPRVTKQTHGWRMSCGKTI